MKKVLFAVLILAIAFFTTAATLSVDITDTYTITNTSEVLYTSTNYVISIVPYYYSKVVVVTLTETTVPTVYTTITEYTTITTGVVNEVYTSVVYTYTFTNYTKTYIPTVQTYWARQWFVTYTTVTETRPVYVTVTASDAITVTGATNETVYVTQDVTTTTVTLTATTVRTVWSTVTNTTINYTATVSYTSATSTVFIQSTNYNSLQTVTKTVSRTATYFLLSVSTVTKTNYGTSQTILIVTVSTTTYSIYTTTTTSTVTITLGVNTFIILGDTYVLQDGIVGFGYHLAAIMYIIAIGVLLFTLFENIFLFAIGKVSGRQLLNTVIIIALVTAAATILDWILGVL